MGVGRQLIIIGLLVAVAATGWVALRPQDGEQVDAGAGTRAPKARTTSVVVNEVVFDAERVRVEAVGTARAARSATLFPATAGEVQAINFTTDAEVAQGDVLLELDREAEELAVDLARVRLADAERVFDRLQRLSASGVAAQARLDEALTSLEAARIELRRSEVALADRFVVAPFYGRIGLTEFDVGDRIGPESEIATLDSRSTLLVRFEVPEALLGRIAVDLGVSVEPWSGGTDPVTGTIVDVGSRVSPDSRTFPVRARIPNPDDRLRPGMSFRVVLDVAGEPHPKVPEIAIQWGGDGAYVWIVADGLARRTPVIIVQRQDTGVLVEGAVGPGQRVVVEGLHRMRDGARVEIVSRAPPSQAPIPAELREAGS